MLTEPHLLRALAFLDFFLAAFLFTDFLPARAAAFFLDEVFTFPLTPAGFVRLVLFFGGMAEV